MRKALITATVAAALAVAPADATSAVPEPTTMAEAQAMLGNLEKRKGGQRLCRKVTVRRAIACLNQRKARRKLYALYRGPHLTVAVTDGMRRVAALAQARGCASRHTWQDRAWFGVGPSMFKWNNAVAWCWRNRRVTVSYASLYQSSVKTSFYYRGSDESYRFAGPGHYTYIAKGQGTFEWCPIQVGCAAQWNPWSHGFSNGNGTYGLRRGW